MSQPVMENTSADLSANNFSMVCSVPTAKLRLHWVSKLSIVVYRSLALDTREAARTGVYWHGLAADRSPNAGGPGAVTALDILEGLRGSASDIDWYHEELDLDDSHVFDPDRVDDSEEEPGTW